MKIIYDYYKLWIGIGYVFKTYYFLTCRTFVASYVISAALLYPRDALSYTIQNMYSFGEIKMFSIYPKGDLKNNICLNLRYISFNKALSFLSFV